MVANDPKDRRLAIAIAVDHLKAERDPFDAERWIYFADETRSWWSVTGDALVQLANLLDEAREDSATPADQIVYESWAEADSTAVERGPRKPRRP